jgi:chromosome partitioning protein
VSGKLAGKPRSQRASQTTCKKTTLPDAVLSGIPTDMLVCLANTKGGVGKSTLAVHLAVWLFDRGARVALLDCDQQRSSSTWIAEAEPKITIATADSPENVLSNARELIQSHDFLIGDAPAGLDERSRTLLILADLVIFPIGPSILDLRSVAQSTAVLEHAQGINQGKPDARVVFNRMRTRDTISRELRNTAPTLGLTAANSIIRDLQVFRDAAQQGTVVTRMGSRSRNAATDLTQLFVELLTDKLAFARRGRTEGNTTARRNSYGRAKIAR